MSKRSGYHCVSDIATL